MRPYDAVVFSTTEQDWVTKEMPLYAPVLQKSPGEIQEYLASVLSDFTAS